MSGLEKIERRMKETARQRELKAAKRRVAQTPDPCALPTAYVANSPLRVIFYKKSSNLRGW